MNRLLITLSLGITIVNSAFCQTQNDTIFNYRTKTPVTIDGQATEECWANAEWHAIDQVWIPYNATMKEGDFEGRFKVSWDENYLYVLVEIIDDSLSDDHANPLSNWWNDDCLEIFVDEDRSKGDHERNCNAFAYHISLFYDAIDLNSSGQGVNYKNNIEVEMDTIGDNTYLWEVAVKNYNATFSLSNPESSRVYLSPGKHMGFAIAYCDNDESTSRENFIGSMVMASATANDMYKNADHFGLMILVDPDFGVSAGDISEQPEITIFPVPAQNYLTIKIRSVPDMIKTVTITNISGQTIRENLFKGDIHTISTEGFDPGIYFLKIAYGNHYYSQMFMKE